MQPRPRGRWKICLTINISAARWWVQHCNHWANNLLGLSYLWEKYTEGIVETNVLAAAGLAGIDWQTADEDQKNARSEALKNGKSEISERR